MEKLKRAVFSPSNHLYSEKHDQVKVCIRMKPNMDSNPNNASPWIMDSNTNPITIQLDPKYCERFKKPNFLTKYDGGFTGSDNFGLYQIITKDLVRSAMDGYNATIFAYGQTSSDYGTEEEPGVIPQAVDEVFKYIKRADGSKQYLLRVSYVEIYNEVIKDLLAPENLDLRIHDDKLRGVYISPVKEEIVTNPKQVMKLIDRGEANRHVASNDYHQHSSRSHTILQMVIESREDGMGYRRHAMPFLKGSTNYGGVKFSQLNLIDLAGSEKATSDLERRKEAAFINKSLLTLGAVIAKIADNKGGHIPYRDSKLTRVLQSSLSGNSRIAVICTINGAGTFVDESIATLKFGSRIKTISIKPIRNMVKEDRTLLQKYQTEINELKVKLNTSNNIQEPLSGNNSNSEELEMLRSKNIQYEEQVMELNLARIAYKERIDHLTNLILTSSSMGDKIFKRSRPMSMHLSTQALTNRFSWVGKHRDRNDKLESTLKDLKFKDRYIQELESLLDMLGGESLEFNTIPGQVHKKFLQVQQMKNQFDDFESDNKDNKEHENRIERRVSNTLGRVASLRLSRQMNSTRHSNNPSLSSLSELSLPAQFQSTSIINNNNNNNINNKFQNEAEVKEMEDIIEDQNKMILELEEDRKVQDTVISDLKSKVKKLQLLQFQRAELDSENNNDNNLSDQQRILQLEKALQAERNWRNQLENNSLRVLGSTSPIIPPKNSNR